jgi:hypothetical protein
VALAPDDLLAGVVAACSGMRGLDRLTVDHCSARARLAARPLPIDRKRCGDPTFI